MLQGYVGKFLETSITGNRRGWMDSKVGSGVNSYLGFFGISLGVQGDGLQG